LYLKNNPEDIYGLDIEADSLTPTVIYCVCVRNLLTEEELTFYNKEEFNAWFTGSYTLVGHNLLSFDAPNLNRLWGSSIDLGRCIDTLVLSYLYNPALEGGHSLAAWGERLRFPKGDFSDWSRLSPEMVEYCKQDVRLTLRVYQALQKKMLLLGFSEKSCHIEHRIREIIDQQQLHGFWFDKNRAERLLRNLRELQSSLSKSIQELFPPKRYLAKTGTLRRTQRGCINAQYGKDVERYPEVITSEEEGTYECYDFQEFNLGSPKQRVERLLELGWVPQDFTKKGFPKVDEDSLVKFAELSGHKAVGALAEWLVLQGRTSMIEGWLNNLGDDSRIHGEILSCGATTRRMVHFRPNTANIPSGAKARYGHECRSLWGVETGKGLVLVGADASGLENVGLLHYLNNKEATKILSQKKPNDVHSMNARMLSEILGREIDREYGAKTGYFAWLFGAYPAKLGSIVKGPPSDGEKMIEVFFKNVPGLKALINDVQYEWKHSSGRLRTVDGGFVLCPSAGASLNYRIQSLGAVVMKLACILLYDEVKRQNLWFEYCGNIHDEWQMVCKEEDGDRLGKLAVQSMTKAAEELKFNVALSGEYKLGLTWADTH
jgi:DNA polymerase-1